MDSLKRAYALRITKAPCVEPSRIDFVSWLKAHQIDDDENWLFLGDFNFYRSLEDRNKPGGNLQDTLTFNDIL